jgi:hypothetical protein
VVEGYPQSHVLFVLVGDRLVGHMYLPFGYFVVERQGDGSFLAQQIDQRAFTPRSDTVASPGIVASAETGTVRTGSADDGSVIDILVAYTQEALGGFGTATAAEAAIDLAVAETNRAFDSSNVRTRLRLVHATSVEYEEVGDATDLTRLRDRGDGFLDVLHDLRDQYAADLVTLITERMDICGRAYVGVPEGLSSLGFAAARRGCLRSITFAHEIGHNLSARHDWYENAALIPYPYGHGYVDLTHRFRDFMSTHDHCADTKTECVVLIAYSNPVVTHYGSPLGVPVGTSTACTAKNLENPPCDADAAQAMGHMAPVVARYRDSRLALRARRLLPGEAFQSASARFRLTYQTDGDLALYDDGTRTRLWASNTAGTAPGQAVLQTDGNLVVYDAAGVERWSSGSAGHPNAYLAVQDDGNLVIYRSDGQPVWSRNQ